MSSPERKHKAEDSPTEASNPEKKAKMSPNPEHDLDKEKDLAEFKKQDMFAKIKRIERKLHGDTHLAHNGGLAWSSMELKVLKEEFGRLDLIIREFTWSWALPNVGDLDCLSETQKATIISSLKHCCVQEGWDDLIGSLVEDHKLRLAATFLEPLLWTSVISKCFENPFWYLDGKTDSDDEEGNSSFATMLNHLYQRFLKTNMYSAARWRSELCRLANSTLLTQAPNQELGHYHKQRRDAVVDLFVDELLSSEPNCWLLRPLEKQEDIESRKQELQVICMHAVQTSAMLGTMRGHAIFYWLDDIDPIFDSESRLTSLHFLHDERDISGMDGQRVLMLSTPAVRAYAITETMGLWEYFAVRTNPLLAIEKAKGQVEECTKNAATVFKASVVIEATGEPRRKRFDGVLQVGAECEN